MLQDGDTGTTTNELRTFIAHTIVYEFLGYIAKLLGDTRIYA